jgi:hypothetical protein
MGSERINDEFSVVPTRLVLEELATYKGHYLSVPTRNGSPRKDDGQWALRLSDLKDEERPGYGLARRGEPYCNNRTILDSESAQWPGR